MDLTSFLPTHKKEDSFEYFWSLIIEPGWVQSCIWRISGKSAQIMERSAAYPWELDDELVNAADTALAGAIQGFPEGTEEPSKTVFGVNASWVADGQIKEKYLEKIKRICSDLSLTPIGFVVIPEAISHFLKSKEDGPLTAILIGVYKEILEISVYNLGNLLGTTQVTRSLSVVEDVTEGILRFAHHNTIPSRFLLYNGKENELEETKQQLLKVVWEDISEIQFLGSPKIEIFSPNQKAEAVSLAGASEISGVTDLIEENLDSPSEALSEESNISEVSPESLGFTVDENMETTAFDGNQEESQPTHQEVQDTETQHQPSKVKSQVTAFFSKTLSSFEQFPSFKLGNPIVLSFIFILLFLVLGFVAWWYLPRALVTIYISPKKLDEKISVTVSSSTSPSENVLAGETVKTSVSGEKTKQTTGTQTVGDRAKGEVKLYRVGTSLSLKSGTSLVGPEKLKFVLDDDIEVASGSASSPGETNAKVTASDIGSEYNVEAGSSFTVGNYSVSEIEAKSENAFSGGNSREIAAVSQDDQKTLEKDLTTELIEKAKEELNSEISDQLIFIDESLSTTLSSKTFTNKVGEEAKNLGISLKLDAQAVTVQKQELLKVAEEAMRDKIPQGFVLREDQIETSFEFIKKDGNDYKFDALISANLLPEVKTDEISQKIKGKNPSLAQEYLIKEVPGFARAEITLKPKLPGKLGTLPHVTKNIDVEVAAEQ